VSETITFEGLSEWQRAEVARHFAQTRHMSFGGAERTKALYFRLPYGHPETLDPSPCAALLAELAAAAAKSGSVKVPRMSKGDAARVSELLRQSAARAARDGRDGGVTDRLSKLWKQWDAGHRVPADEYDRAERILYA
jgi:hypothetical protein